MSEDSVRGQLARSKDGSVVHRTSCRYARVPWNWADNKPLWVVAETVRWASWLRACGKCKPFGEAR